MKSSTATAAKGSSPSKAPQSQKQPQVQSKKQAKKGKEKLAFDIPYDVDVPSLSDSSKMNTIMGFVGQLIFATTAVPRPQKPTEPEKPPQKKAKIECEEKKEEEAKEKAKAKRKEKTPKDKDGSDLRMFVVGVNAVARIVEKDEATAKRKVRCVVVASSESPASEDFVARHIAMCCASLKLPVCVLDTTSAELGKAFNVPSVMAFAVKTEEFFNETNAPKAKQGNESSPDKEGAKAPVGGPSESASGGASEKASESEENVKRKRIADNLVSLITENQSNIALPWSGEYGELKPLKASPLQRNPSRVKKIPKKKLQAQKKAKESKKDK